MMDRIYNSLREYEGFRDIPDVMIARQADDMYRFRWSPDGTATLRIVSQSDEEINVEVALINSKNASESMDVTETSA